MMQRRWISATIGAALAAGALVACSFVQSLDYLQNGAAPLVEGGSEEDAGSEGGLRKPEIVAANQTKPSLLAQDDAALYWIAAGTVMTVAKSGGAPRALGIVAGATDLAVDPDPSGGIYLAVGTDVVRIPKDGSDAGTVFKASAGAPLANTVVADDTTLFLLEYDDTVEGSQIVRMAKDGGAPSIIDRDAGGAPSTLTVDSKSIVWLDTLLVTNGAFVERPKAAPPATASTSFALAQDDDPPSASDRIAVDDVALYWATDGAVGAPAVVSRKREKNAPVIALYRGKPEETFGKLTSDGTSLYVIETSTNAILRVPKQGGGADRLATDLQVPTGIVVDATNVYFTVEATGSQGAVLKLTK